MTQIFYQENHWQNASHCCLFSGRLMRANTVDFNWHKLAAWANITEQWPYILSWIILEIEDNENVEDTATLKSIYDL